MSSRFYVLLAGPALAERVVTGLRERGFDDAAIHAVARHDPHHELPEAGLLDTTEVGPATGRGVAAGAATGLVAGLGALAFPPLGIVIGGGTVLASSLAGAGFGAWVASMIGISETADDIVVFEDAVAAGQVLLLIDAHDRDAVAAAVHAVAPQATIREADEIS